MLNTKRATRPIVGPSEIQYVRVYLCSSAKCELKFRDRLSGETEITLDSIHSQNLEKSVLTCSNHAVSKIEILFIGQREKRSKERERERERVEILFFWKFLCISVFDL